MSDLSPRAIFADLALLEDGWAADVRIILRQGRISGIERDTAVRAGDERHGCVIPALGNLHSHAFQRGMAGLAERRGHSDDSFWTWREVMYRFLDRMTPDDLHAVAAMAYLEMLESGFARVGEFHYLHHAPDGRAYADPAEMSVAIARAAAETGIGLTLLPVFYAHSGFGALPPSEGQRRFLHDLDGFARLLEGAGGALAGLDEAVLGLAPHSLRAVSPEQLAALESMAGAGAGAGAGPIHIHIAEQVREVEDCLAWSGRRPVEWLLDHAAVDRRWCLVHATHMTQGEARAVARSGAVAGLCPITEANLGDGLFPAGEFLAEGGVYGIGSDSNVLIDAAEELRLLEYGQRLTRRGRNLLADAATPSTGEAVWRRALDGGGQALGAKGGLSIGLAFDALSLDLGHPSLAARGADRLLDGLVFAAGRSAVDCVWRFGAQVVSGGRHHARDGVVRRYTETLNRLIG
ncbi:formimidoylglutamate deiminase [Novosphingobium sp. ST904]|uniref:formimidoylglutamate deiminase n=1 Tax=Novosphingobium sp. ST904 TaxID=1684385 RepID=UPI0006C8B18B|nr:formimidoylglutamate deiminase [Novosphingobium sp. ST904]KPH58916.1 N-formimino-L-glutamate deiminase [Novosphingobium sp. ST904]TCM37157.1 formimidoylglutamate deiminase [Novosphingobium sp. ST904]